MISSTRATEIDQVISAIARWAAAQPDIDGAAIVGSVARGTARTDSDVDVIVLTDDEAKYAESEDWISEALPEAAPIIRTQSWGVVLERRVRLSTGLEVEFGFTTPHWASTAPIDVGTARVVRDGIRLIVDRQKLFERLISRVQADI